MIVAPMAAEIESFRGLVAERLGLHFEDAKLDFLADVLRKRMEDTGCSRFSMYQGRISSTHAEKGEVCALAEQLTVGETYFFRYTEHFTALAEVVLPARIQARRGERRLRILSAGCASGEEPYSVAILIREQFPELESWDVEILGFDINPAMVERSRRARYSSWSLRETPDHLRVKYFRSEGRELQLNGSVRSSVRFEERNLVGEDAMFWQPEAFDVIFCRNVTMYFTPEVTRSVIARIARSLAAGGFLFLGHAETLRAVSHEFHLRHTHDTFYYQRREIHDGPEGMAFGETIPEGRSVATCVNAPVESNDSWFSIIQGASDRIASLTQEKDRSADGASGAGVRLNSSLQDPHSWDRGRAVELLRNERFTDAVELLRSLPSESSKDPDAQLLLAVLHTNRGDLGEAEKVCRRVLELDELNAGAHYVTALCREHAGDRDGAIRHDQTAVYLDSAFAMPHVHLGLLAKRLTDLETARREFARAIPLLDREDPARILLFGGGFTREALVELCRAELCACGGAA